MNHKCPIAKTCLEYPRCKCGGVPTGPSIVEQLDSVLVTRPQYDDTNLGNEKLWTLDNSALLARYWQQLGRALGVDDPEGEEDIDLFCSEQHRQQMRQHPGYMYERAS